MLALEFARLCGGEWEKALPFACGIEMVQTYSLIHDDLPCMDDDDLRRGKPSCHVQFDEATALLAGDGLLTMAFEALSDADLPPERIVRAVGVLARSIGADGMIGGQEMDLANEGRADLPLAVIRRTNEKKTAALLQASCLLGVLAAGGSEAQLAAAGQYGLYLGLAFQVVDDILDETGDAEKLGKPIGSDAGNDKSTYVSALGLDGARRYAEEYTAQALTALEVFSDAEPLKALTEKLLRRSS
jgi:geranylgeranyl diphosphate synthase type II